MTEGESEISLRPATADDEDMVFRWRNDPFILARGSLQRTVSQEEHNRWFRGTIGAATRKMFIILNRAIPVGQVRFDRTTERGCVISIYLLKEFTGRGWGVQAIRKGCAAIFDAWDVERVVACVREDNPSGQTAFLRAGFIPMEPSEFCPPESHSLIFSQSPILEGATE